MSADISAIRTQIATQLANVSGLRTSGDVPDNVNPPVAVVFLESIEYDQTFRQGLTAYNFNIMVIVSSADDRTAQRKLNGYAAPTGAGSIKSAVESDRSLNGLAQTLIVRGMTNIGSLQLNDQEYMAAEFNLAVYV